MIDDKELQGRIDWVCSRVAEVDRRKLRYELVWRNFPAGPDAEYPAHSAVLWTFEGIELYTRVGVLLHMGDSAYYLLFDMRRELGIEVDTSKRPKFAPPAPVLSPIGDPWPARGRGAYHVVGTEKWRSGDPWEDESGVYIGEWRRHWLGISYYVWVKQEAVLSSLIARAVAHGPMKG